MSPRAARSPNNLQVARSAVAERARRYAAPPSKGHRAKGAGGAKSAMGKAAKDKERGTKGAAPTPSTGKAPRSTRVVLRHVHPMSVLRVSVLFYLGMCLALFIAGVLLWLGASAVGLVSNIEGFMDDVGFTDFQLRAGPLLFGSALASVVLVVTGSLGNYLMAVLYNLIADVVGGVKVVLTEDRDTEK